MKSYILLPICICFASYTFSQKTQYSTNPDARRAAALAKVQGHTGSTMTAKGGTYAYNNEAPRVLSPATYSTPTVRNAGPGTPSKTSAKGSGTGAPKTTVKGPAATSTAKTTAKTPAATTAKAADVKPVTYNNAGTSVAATTVTVHGQTVERKVRKGRGQEGNDLFTPVSELHYVQFAVYCKDVPVDKAPAIDGLYLLWHPGSKCPNGEPGASYIVKGYTTIEEAKAAVKTYKAAKIDCWYNPALSGAEVEIIGVR